MVTIMTRQRVNLSLKKKEFRELIKVANKQKVSPTTFAKQCLLEKLGYLNEKEMKALGVNNV